VEIASEHPWSSLPERTAAGDRGRATTAQPPAYTAVTRRRQGGACLLADVLSRPGPALTARALLLPAGDDLAQLGELRRRQLRELAGDAGLVLGQVREQVLGPVGRVFDEKPGRRVVQHLGRSRALGGDREVSHAAAA